MGRRASAVVGCGAREGLDGKGQGKGAPLPYRVWVSAFFCGVAGGGLVREVWTDS